MESSKLVTHDSSRHFTVLILLLATLNESKPNGHYRERIVRAIEFEPEELSFLF